MIKKSIKKNKAFVLLFAVTLSAILLSIALGVSNITFRELKFSTNARDSNNAFFAADTGAECAEYYDKAGQDKFLYPSSSDPITIGDCAGESITATPNESGNFYCGSFDTSCWAWDFVIHNSSSQASGDFCATVEIAKVKDYPFDHPSDPLYAVTTTSIVSKGYNTAYNSGPDCTSSNPNRVEREFDANYPYF